MRNFIKTAITSIVLATASVSAFAADVTWGTYEGTNNAYINYVGETTEGDLNKIASLINDLEANSKINFTGDMYLYGPGGSAYEGQAIADYISARGDINTIVYGGEWCYSACAMIWLGAGEDNRYVFEGGLVAFHLPYIPMDPSDPQVGNFYEDAKNTYGWQATLDFHNSMVIESLAADLSYGIKNVVWYISEMAKTTPGVFLEVDTAYEVTQLIGGQWIPAK